MKPASLALGADSRSRFQNVVLCNLAFRFLVLLALLCVSLPLRAEPRLSENEQARVDEARSELAKALSREGLAESERARLVERSAKTLKEYGQGPGFPEGDIPLKVSREAAYRKVAAEVVYANDLRAALSNMLMSQRLSIINSLQIDVLEDQIKLALPGSLYFDLSKDAVGQVFSWNIKDGFGEGKHGDSKELVQRFKQLATSKDFLRDLTALYEEEREMLLQRYEELNQAYVLEDRLATLYENAANSTFVLKEFQQGDNGALVKISPRGQPAPAPGVFSAVLPGGWKQDRAESGQLIASMKRLILPKTQNSKESHLDVKVTAHLEGSSRARTPAELDKALRSWLASSGWSPEEASVVSFRVGSFRGRMLMTTLKYKQGFGGAMSGYSAGMAHMHAYALLVEEGGSQTIKVSCSSFAGSPWDNKSADISKAEAKSGFDEGMQLVRGLSVQASPVGAGTSKTSPPPADPARRRPGRSPYDDPRPLTGAPLRERLLHALTHDPATKQEALFWTDREQLLKNDPLLSPSQPEAAPVASDKTTLAVLSGDWDIISNGYAGKLELRVVGGALEGRVYFNVLRKWEPLQSVAYESQTRTLSFYRPNGKQHYRGVLNGATLSGTFDGKSAWTAKRQ